MTTAGGWGRPTARWCSPRCSASPAACRSACAEVWCGCRCWSLFLVGTLIAQARAGTAVLCLILVYAVLRPTMALWARALTTVILGGAAYLALTFGLAAGLADRIANDSGSGAARLRALRFISDTAGHYIGTGRGPHRQLRRRPQRRAADQPGELVPDVRGRCRPDPGDALLRPPGGHGGPVRTARLPAGRDGGRAGGDRSAARLQRCGRGQPDRDADLGRAGHRRGRLVRPGRPTARSADRTPEADLPADAALASSANAADRVAHVSLL